MLISKNLREDYILKELSQRLKRYRIDYPMTQAELAEKSMVSLSTIIRFEKGEDISFLKAIRIIYALDLENNLNELVPDYTDRPSFYFNKKSEKQRARKAKATERKWKWGDEE